ncbi:hypothetical protein IJH26_00045 [Candidatus Saccharibacteria bacterium]|nr:hypothetical protein [Candidatus Saccharibacteria bacterium]MBQ3475894.1 hypothetical protein [Candidatus Saccharibacteria bacterium]
MKKGKIIPNGVILEKHEYKTVLFFTEMGIDVELIPKSERKGVHAPDVIMDELKWEIKSPKGEGKYLMQNTIQKAVKQSKNVIVDLRRTKRLQERCLKELEKEFNNSRSLRRLKIITKSRRILDFEK